MLIQEWLHLSDKFFHEVAIEVICKCSDIHCKHLCRKKTNTPIWGLEIGCLCILFIYVLILRPYKVNSQLFSIS